MPSKEDSLGRVMSSWGGVPEGQAFRSCMARERLAYKNDPYTVTRMVSEHATWCQAYDETAEDGEEGSPLVDGWSGPFAVILAHICHASDPSSVIVSPCADDLMSGMVVA
jgi:hypothetical protein